MLQNFRNFLSAAIAPSKGGGAGQLPPAPEPKLKGKQQSVDSFKTQVAASTATIQTTDLRLANIDIAAEYRTGVDTPTVIRNLVRANPDMNAAVSAYLRLGIPEKYIVLARDPDGTVNDDATRLAFEMLQRFDKLPAYDSGFAQADSIRSISEAMGKEAAMYGGLAMELVLDAQRIPYKFQPLSVTKIKFKEDKSGPSTGLKPFQDIGGVEIDLDLPTVFILWLDPLLTEISFLSPMESAIQPVLASTTFLNDLRRVCARHVYPRYKVLLDEEKLRKSIPDTVLNGPPDELNAFLDARIGEVEDTINALGPEEAFVGWDWIDLQVVEAPGEVPATFQTVQDLFNSKIATGLRTMPAVLGHGAGSQNVASTETSLFMLSANSMIRLKLQEMYSQAFTLAVRLFGYDVTVGFEFDPISLRPAEEMEAFKAMYQERITTQWSLGMIGDMEACMRLTYAPPPAGFKTLSGTMFKDAKQALSTENPYSGTSTGPGGGADVQSRKPKTPTQPKG